MHEEKLPKAILLAVLTVLFFGIIWYLLNIGIAENPSLVFWVALAIVSSIAISFLAFLSIIDLSQRLFWGVNLVILALYILLLPKQPAVMIGGLVFFIFTLFGSTYLTRLAMRLRMAREANRTEKGAAEVAQAVRALRDTHKEFRR